MLTKIVTAPFRALGSLFGISSEKLEAIDSDPGSDRLLPAEREKLIPVAQVLSKRPHLKLSVPARSPVHWTRARALRDLYAERFGAVELDKQKKAAEGAAAADVKAGGVQEKLPIWKRVGNLVKGEPQVADPIALYHALQKRLEQNQSLAPDALTRLGGQRASAIVAALTKAGIDPARTLAAAPENVSSDMGKPVSVKLELAAR